MITIYHNSKCSKSRCALDILEREGFDFEVVNYLETNPDKYELSLLIKKLGITAHELVRKSESVYIENYKDKELSEDEWIMAMADHPVLIERPILVSGDKAVIARPAEKIYDVLSTV